MVNQAIRAGVPESEHKKKTKIMTLQTKGLVGDGEIGTEDLTRLKENHDDSIYRDWFVKCAALEFAT